MTDQEKQLVYESPIPFDTNRIRAAAVYCSDGRFGMHCDDFLQNSLQLPRYDRLALPGGAACLAGHFLAFRAEEALAEQLRFLLQVHAIRRVVLIAHQDCAFYTERLHVPPAEIEARQQEDIQTAARRVRSLAPGLQVDAFFARKRPDRTICFESMPIV